MTDKSYLHVTPGHVEPGQTIPDGFDQPLDDIVPDPVNMADLRPRIIEALRTIFDPEIPVNIYELGLIYDVLVDQEGVAGVRMTLTAPACPAAQTLPVEVRDKAKSVEGVADARVQIVWDPPWTRDRMSDVAKLELGMMW
jgi:FeS assembly SUF system protein